MFFHSNSKVINRYLLAVIFVEKRGNFFEGISSLFIHQYSALCLFLLFFWSKCSWYFPFSSNSYCMSDSTQHQPLMTCSVNGAYSFLLWDHCLLTRIKTLATKCTQLHDLQSHKTRVMNKCFLNQNISIIRAVSFHWRTQVLSRRSTA